MRELPEDLTNSLRSFRGSIYGRGQTRQEDQNARTDDVDLEKGSEDYGDKEFERAFNTSQSTLDMVLSYLSSKVYDYIANLVSAAISYISPTCGPSPVTTTRWKHRP